MAIETPRSLVDVVEDMAARWIPAVGIVDVDDDADLEPRKLNSAARQSMDAIEQLLKRAGSPAKMINAAMNSSEWILLKDVSDCGCWEDGESSEVSIDIAVSIWIAEAIRCQLLVDAKVQAQRDAVFERTTKMLMDDIAA